MNILELKPHPLAAEMPKLEKHELAALTKSMEEEGFDDEFKIWVWKDPKIGEDTILDGVNRRDVAKKLGICRIPWVRFEGTFEQAATFVANRQLGRRSPTSSQRAGIMAVYRKRMKECGKQITLEAAADQAGVSLSQMEKASALAHKSKRVTARVLRGELTVGEAANRIKRVAVETHRNGEDPMDEIMRTRDKLTAAEDALVRWAAEYLDPVIERRGAEMLAANLRSRARVVAGKRVMGLAMIDEMVQTIKRNKPKKACPTCNGSGCADCGDRRYITAHEEAMAKNAK